MFSLLQSSAVNSITYRQGKIEVQWVSDPRPFVYSVTPDEAYAILTAQSKGRVLNATVKDGRPFRKIF